MRSTNFHTVVTGLRDIARNPMVKQAALVGAGLALVALVDPAFAQSTASGSGSDAITSGLNSIKSWLTGITSVVGILAVMGVGYMKLTGRMQWPAVISVMVGLGIIFSASTIVGWFSSGS